MNYTSLSELNSDFRKNTKIESYRLLPSESALTTQTSQPKACSQYGLGNITLGAGEIYTGTPWCQIGIVMNENKTHLNNIFLLEARYINNLWAFRVKDPMIGVYIYLDTIGNGQNGAYRTNDTLNVPGKDGLWKVQVQVQYQQSLAIP
jgi:hypothetical protein